MNFIEIFLIAIGLAMDCFAVSISYGIKRKHITAWNIIKPALFFGLFQAFMPVLGWFAGIQIKEFITGIDHWISFILLSCIGGKMIYEHGEKQEIQKNRDPFQTTVLFGLAIATSIDALAIGISFAFLNISLLFSVTIIGMVSFLFSCVGVVLGNRIGHFFEKYIHVIGGMVLIGIGLKILVEHLFGI